MRRKLLASCACFASYISAVEAPYVYDWLAVDETGNHEIPFPEDVMKQIKEKQGDKKAVLEIIKKHALVNMKPYMARYAEPTANVLRVWVAELLDATLAQDPLALALLDGMCPLDNKLKVDLQSSVKRVGSKYPTSLLLTFACLSGSYSCVKKDDKYVVENKNWNVGYKEVAGGVFPCADYPNVPDDNFKKFLIEEFARVKANLQHYLVNFVYSKDLREAEAFLSGMEENLAAYQRLYGPNSVVKYFNGALNTPARSEMVILDAVVKAAQSNRVLYNKLQPLVEASNGTPISLSSVPQGSMLHYVLALIVMNLRRRLYDLLDDQVIKKGKTVGEVLQIQIDDTDRSPAPRAAPVPRAAPSLRTISDIYDNHLYKQDYIRGIYKGTLVQQEWEKRNSIALLCLVPLDSLISSLQTKAKAGPWISMKKAIPCLN